MFSSGSSLRSIVGGKQGVGIVKASPVHKPSIQGNNFRAQWSVCSTTGTPYAAANSWT